MSIYGWHVWIRKDESTGADLTTVGRCTAREFWTAIIFGVLAFAVLGSSLPGKWIDAFVGQFCFSKRSSWDVVGGQSAHKELDGLFYL